MHRRSIPIFFGIRDLFQRCADPVHCVIYNLYDWFVYNVTTEENTRRIGGRRRGGQEQVEQEEKEEYEEEE